MVTDGIRKVTHPQDPIKTDARIKMPVINHSSMQIESILTLI